MTKKQVPHLQDWLIEQGRMEDLLHQISTLVSERIGGDEPMQTGR